MVPNPKHTFVHFVARILILTTYSGVVIGYLTKLTGTNSKEYGQVVYNSTECTKDNFTESGECSLVCTAHLENLYEWHWIYYINDTLENVTIYDGVNRADSPDSNCTQITLTLTNYSAGYYQCWYHYISTTTHLTTDEFEFENFQVDPEESGVTLKQSCHQSTQCLSLDATCKNNVCLCISPYLYPMDTSQGTLACLKGVGPFEPCNIDEQCITAGENYNCTNHICDCMATYTYVAEVNKYLCLMPVSEGETCRYQEECTLTDVSMWCYNNVCDCKDYYYFNVTLNQCINGSYYPNIYPDDDDGLSFGAIVGIIVGSAAAIVIFFAIIGLTIVILRSRA